MVQHFKSTAQFGEDWIAFMLSQRRTDGFYIEIGGNSPIFDSTTFSLYRLGWHGIVFEPNPVHKIPHRAIRPRDHFVEAAAWSEDKELQLVIPNVNGWARTSEIGLESTLFQSSQKISTIQVSGVRVSTALKSIEFDGEIDFMSIDVEGDVLQVLKGMEFTWTRPKVICIEASEYTSWELQQTEDNSGPSLKFLCGQGYRVIGRDQANYWLVDETLDSIDLEFRPPILEIDFNLMGHLDYEEILQGVSSDLSWGDMKDLVLEIFRKESQKLTLIEKSRYFKIYSRLRKLKRSA
jgi:FkbM family methyltransferase